MPAPVDEDLGPALHANRHDDCDLLRHFAVAQQASERGTTSLFQLGLGTGPRRFEVGYQERGDLMGEGFVV